MNKIIELRTLSGLIICPILGSGIVTRMSAKRSEKNKLLSYLSKLNRNESSIYAIIIF